MSGAKEPSQVRALVQIDEALVGLIRRRDIHEGETDPRRHLKDEEGKRRASEDVPEARGTARNRVSEDGSDCRTEARAVFQPFRNCGPELPGHHTGSLRVGICPPRTWSLPSRTAHSYSKRPRGGGPEAREPSS